ncbi:hypothetical protein RI129_007904 [Pyrocoelia pectoralis]|uniref:Lipase domain-containing protein n=1 Tax=Pyrocoelia pectoralis TaxID=417401 RepID=A0AAN7VIH7_9COLE
MKNTLAAVLLCTLVHLSLTDLCSYNFTFGDMPKTLVGEALKLFLGGVLNFITDCKIVDYNEGQTKFLLYTRNNPNTPIELNNSNFAILGERKTILLTHGFLCNHLNDLLPEMKDAYLARYDKNIIIIDWSAYSLDYYVNCYCNLPKIAKYVARSLCIADLNGDIRISETHFVGHSMGGQLVGLVGQQVQEICGKMLYRISALDPAGPLYTGINTKNRLDPTDAQIVMVIHSNTGGLGYPGNCGTVDYYPNMGSYQKGCSITDSPVETIVDKAAYPIICSHLRAVSYMIESISSNRFKGKSCLLCGSCIPNPFSSTYGTMGEDFTADEVPCSYYMNTRDEPPYGMGV